MSQWQQWQRRPTIPSQLLKGSGAPPNSKWQSIITRRRTISRPKSTSRRRWSLVISYRQLSIPSLASRWLKLGICLKQSTTTSKRLRGTQKTRHCSTTSAWLSIPMEKNSTRRKGPIFKQLNWTLLMSVPTPILVRCRKAEVVLKKPLRITKMRCIWTRTTCGVTTTWPMFIRTLDSWSKPKTTMRKLSWSILCTSGLRVISASYSEG